MRPVQTFLMMQKASPRHTPVWRQNLPRRRWAPLPGSAPRPWPCCRCWAGGSTGRSSAGRPKGPACTPNLDTEERKVAQRESGQGKGNRAYTALVEMDSEGLHSMISRTSYLWRSGYIICLCGVSLRSWEVQMAVLCCTTSDVQIKNKKAIRGLNGHLLHCIKLIWVRMSHPKIESRLYLGQPFACKPQ